MPEFGEFGERSPEEIAQLMRALRIIGGSELTNNQLDYFLVNRGKKLASDADDIERRDHYVLNDPRYETAVKGEHSALLVAVDALAKYFMAEDKTHETRTTLEGEASRLLIAANRISSTPEVSSADFANE